MNDLKDKIVVVTGGSGFIGKHLVERLVLTCKKVVNLDIAEPAKRVKNCSFKKINISDFKEVSDGIQGSDIVFHLSSRSFPESLKNPREDFLAGALGTFNVLEASKQHQVRKVVYASSFLVYGNPVLLPITEKQVCQPISPYGASKLSSEIYCSVFSKLFHLNTVSLRFANVYGPSQVGPYLITSVIEKFKKGEKITVFGTGKQSRDFIFVSDVVDGLIQAAQSNTTGEVYNISSGKETTILNIIETLSRISGKKAEIEFHPVRKGDVKRFFLSNKKAKKFIYFTPKVKLEEGLKQTWESYHS